MNDKMTDIGKEMHGLIRELYPICRSITGDGVRKTLKIVGDRIPLKIHEVPTGNKVFDWTVPKEWNIRGAYIKNSAGKRIVDFERSNLHVLNYSVPISKRLPFSELKEHLHTLPAHPDWIPYKTSYYKETWGFCLSHNQFLSLEDEDYEVKIDSVLEPGHLTYGECLIPGASKNEVLISTHVCHPSLANDNLSGVCTAVLLASLIGQVQLKHTYRFLFIPGTIGAITWLSLNQKIVSNIKYGIVLTGVGDAGNITYKKSRQGNAAIDRVVQYVLANRFNNHTILEFSPYGYDERQYCSPGFNLPVWRLSRTPYGEYPQYHSSADNLTFVRAGSLGESCAVLMDTVSVIENNATFVNQNPKCEPQLGRRGLYSEAGDREMAMLWVLNLSDGTHSLLDIAERSKIPFTKIRQAADLLSKHRLIV